MKKTIATLSVLVLLAGIPALAGEGHKCKAGTQDCLNKMAAGLQNKGLIGVDGEWCDVSGGFRVESYIPGTHAEQAGVQIGDVFLAVNGIELSDEATTKADRENRMPGSNVSVTVLRGNEKKILSVTLSAMTDEQATNFVGRHMLDHAVIAQND